MDKYKRLLPFLIGLLLVFITFCRMEGNDFDFKVSCEQGLDNGQSESNNLIRNADFTLFNKHWIYDGAFIQQSDDKARVLIDPGPSSFLAQTVIIPETGYYQLQSIFKRVDASGAEFGIRYPKGSVIVQKAVLQNDMPCTQMIDKILLEKGSLVEIYFTGINSDGKWIELKDPLLALASCYSQDISSLTNMLSLAVLGQVDVTQIDTDVHKVQVTVPYGMDLKEIAPNLTISQDASVTPSSGMAQDFTEPVEYTITNQGKRQLWIVECHVGEKEIIINSSNLVIEEAFQWAVQKARSYVRTGKHGLINRDETFSNSPEIKEYMPSYWAGYAHRSAFYIRDFVHQMTGAHLLGLDRENLSMLKAFAGTSNQLHKWYPAWALNFDGSLFKLDYRDSDHFVREVPAVFELVEKAYHMYLWTGDQSYLEDATLWNYYSKVVTDFIELHDEQMMNGVAEGTGGGIFQGTATYNERMTESIIEAGDGIGSQYQALLSYAELCKAKGEYEAYRIFKNRAEDLKEYFNQDWGVKGIQNGYIRGYGSDGKSYSDFAKEPSWFMPMKQITEVGERTNTFLEFIDQMVETSEGAPSNIEAYTYLPDTFFPFSYNEQAWKWMKYIINGLQDIHEVSSQGTNGDYPEVSYTLISQTVEGLMGISPNAPEHKVTTLSRLPKDISWLELDHVALGSNDLYMKHEGVVKSTMRNNAGSGPIIWEVQFVGDYSFIQLNGVLVQAQTKLVNGVKVSYTCVNLAIGESIAAVPVTS